MILAFIVALIQILLGFSDADIPSGRKESSDDRVVKRLIDDLTGTRKWGSIAGLADGVKAKLEYFLKGAAFIMYFYTDIPMPEGTGFKDISKYLGLPDTIQGILELPGVAAEVER